MKFGGLPGLIFKLNDVDKEYNYEIEGIEKKTLPIEMNIPIKQKEFIKTDRKTFMCIRDSLDIVKRIISLTVNFPRARGVLQVKYEADNYQFLTLHILEGKYYSEEEFQQIWGLYKEYERKRSGSAMHENPAAVDTKAM